MNVGIWSLFDVFVPREMTTYVTYKLLFIRHASRCVFLFRVSAKISWAYGQALTFSCLYMGQQVMYASFDIARQLELLL